jgi:diaminohydroxyphosphoribosylaminopyrimidine deaminase / 5-amino-6-(5-phosphoribosylamino)uracil reductase
MPVSNTSPDIFSKEDFVYMKKALSLAKRAMGRTSPNPMVGAVVVNGGRVLATGYHKGPGTPHAEVDALNKIKGQAEGATIYVTLEPCCHWGQNPPCTNAIIDSGIKAVIFATKDPNPLVKKGNTIKLLEAKGLRVKVGLCESEAKTLNTHYNKYISSKKPYVSLKLATTLDGKVADRYGTSKWITGEAARVKVHQLRFQHDAILVGIGTVLVDNPSLDIRLKNKKKRYTKIIIDRTGQLSPDAKLFDSGDSVIIVRDKKLGTKDVAYPKHSEIMEIASVNGAIDLDQLLLELGELKIQSLFVEGGSKIAYSFMTQDNVETLYLFSSGKILGDNLALPMLNGESSRSLVDAQNYVLLKLKQYGNDVFMEYVRPN